MKYQKLTPSQLNIMKTLWDKKEPMIASDFIDISIIKLKKTMRIINILCISLAGGITIMLVYSIFAITDYVDRGAGNMIF